MSIKVKTNGVKITTMTAIVKEVIEANFEVLAKIESDYEKGIRTPNCKRIDLMRHALGVD